MASQHHHHHHNQNCLNHQNHHNNISQFATSPHCCTHPSPPPEANLLHLVASYLQNHQQETQCFCETQFQSFNGVRRHQQKNVPRQREYDNVVLSCLLRKIDDLESSLNKFSAFYDQRRDRRSTTLRDSAARVIQTHFRSYLVHRSVSFRQLKELAMIKSSFLSLKSSVSGKPHFPFKAVSRKATDLLLQLDSIQGRIDPMIRSSKRSLSRDLVRFLQYIDDCAIKRYDFVGKPQGLGVAEDRTFEKLRKLMGKVVVTSSGDEDNNADMTDDSEEVSMNAIDKRKIGSTKSRTGGFVKAGFMKPPVRKSVVFDKKRNVYHVYGNTHDLTSSAEDDDSVESDEETLVMSGDSGKRHSSKAGNVVLVKGSGGKTNRVVKTVSFDENGNVYKVNGDTKDLTSSAEDNSVDSDEEALLVSRDNGRRHDSKARNVVFVKGSGGKTNKVVKTVSFDENGNVYKVNGDINDQTSSADGDGHSVDSDEEALVISRDNGRKHNSKARKVVLVKGSGGKTNRVVKTVSFDEKGNVYKVYGDTPESSITEEDDSTSGSNDGNGNEVEEIKYVPKENKGFEEEEEEEEETHSEDEVSSSEESEENARVTRIANHSESKEHKKEIQLQEGSLMFSPPLPLKMEP